jgi:hypothetical protein
MARLIITAHNKRGQVIGVDKFLAIYRDASGVLFTGNKGYDTLIQAIRKNGTAVGAIHVGEWLEIAKDNGIAGIDESLSQYVA